MRRCELAQHGDPAQAALISQACAVPFRSITRLLDPAAGDSSAAHQATSTLQRKCHCHRRYKTNTSGYTAESGGARRSHAITAQNNRANPGNGFGLQYAAA
jgi:hypothetical protein